MSSTLVDVDGGVMTRNTKSCFAEVEYEVENVIYRANWSIRRNSKNTIEPHRHEVSNTVTKEVLNSKSSEAVDINEKIIGLDYTQFVQAMVLSQGQFSKLLHSDRKDRNKLLEEITGAKDYRIIGNAVHERKMSLTKQVDNQKAKLEVFTLFTPEEIEEKTSAVAVLSKEEPGAKKRRDSLEKQIQAKLLHEKLLKEKNSNDENQKIHLQKELENKDKKLILNKHNQLVKYQPNLTALSAHVTKVDNLNNTLADNEQSTKLQLEEKNQLFKRAKQLIQKEVTDKTIKSELNDFRNKITKLIDKEKTKLDEANLIKSNIEEKWSSIIDLGYDLKVVESVEICTDDLNKLTQSIDETIRKAGVVTLSELEEKLKNLKEDLSKVNTLIIKLTAYNLNKTSNDKRISDVEKGQKSASEIRKSSLALKKENDDLGAEVKKMTKALKEKRQHQSLDEHRKTLIEGDPCPLCGSLSHPYSEHEPNYNIEEELLDSKEKIYNRNELLIASENTNLNNLIKNEERLILEIKEAEKGLTPALAEIKTGLKELKLSENLSKESLEQNKSLLEEEQKLIESSESAFRAKLIVKSSEEALLKWKNALDGHSKATNDRVKLYKGSDVEKEVVGLTDSTSTVLTTIINLEKELVKLKKDHKQNKEDGETICKEINAILKKESLKDVNDLKSQILSETDAETIRTKLRELGLNKARLEEAQKRILKNLKEAKAKDDTTLTLENAQNQFAEAETVWKDINNQITRLQTILKGDADQRKKQQQELTLLEKLQKDEKLWKTMDKMIGGGQGEKFSNFVQDLTMEQLIGYTNIRLAGLSDRYKLQAPNPKIDTKRTSLKVYDADMGNQLRAVKTLSGGETFIVSLAMAFALSDLAAKNIKIESIFIDEGFGTLDPDTLDQAITILEKLQNEDDKYIGVISHVEALKGRISTQIKLEKSGAGYSSFTID